MSDNSNHFAPIFRNAGIEKLNILPVGKNTDGQLGTGNTATYSVPTQIKNGVTFKAIDTGENHSMAIDSNGNLYINGGTIIQTAYIRQSRCF